jgi:hypothetical protein
MTSKEIKQELTNILREYLHTNDITFSGNYKKEQLEKKLISYKKMLELKKEAENLIKDYTNQQQLSAGMTGTDQNYNKYCELLKQAQEIYFGREF